MVIYGDAEIYMAADCDSGPAPETSDADQETEDPSLGKPMVMPSTPIAFGCCLYFDQPNYEGSVIERCGGDEVFRIGFDTVRSMACAPD